LILFHLAFFISLAQSLGSFSVFSVNPVNTWQKFLGIYIAIARAMAPEVLWFLRV
jgi:hypothetical protein